MSGVPNGSPHVQEAAPAPAPTSTHTSTPPFVKSLRDVADSPEALAPAAGKRKRGNGKKSSVEAVSNGTEAHAPVAAPDVETAPAGDGPTEADAVPTRAEPKPAPEPTVLGTLSTGAGRRSGRVAHNEATRPAPVYAPPPARQQQQQPAAGDAAGAKGAAKAKRAINRCPTCMQDSRVLIPAPAIPSGRRLTEPALEARRRGPSPLPQYDSLGACVQCWPVVLEEECPGLSSHQTYMNSIKEFIDAEIASLDVTGGDHLVAVPVCNPFYPYHVYMI